MSQDYDWLCANVDNLYGNGLEGRRLHAVPVADTGPGDLDTWAVHRIFTKKAEAIEIERVQVPVSGIIGDRDEPLVTVLERWAGDIHSYCQRVLAVQTEPPRLAGGAE